MLGLFPTLGHDELLYSAVARYATMLGCTTDHQVHTDVFGRRYVVAVPDLPTRLDAFLSRLPGGHGYNVDVLIDRHTTLPFYQPFASPLRIAAVRDLMKGAGGSRVHYALGLIGSAVHRPAHFNFCRACVEDDLSKVGMPTWRRVHQLPGVLRCPDHAAWLLQSTVARANRRRRGRFAALTSRLVDAGTEIQAPSRAAARMQHIANDVQMLLTSSYSPHEPDALHARLVFALRQTGWARGLKRVRLQALSEAFEASYGSEVLKRLGCGLRGDQDSGTWLARMVHAPRTGHHPVQWLLLLRFIGVPVGEFLGSIGASVGVAAPAPQTRPRRALPRGGARNVVRDGHRIALLEALGAVPGSTRMEVRSRAQRAYEYLRQRDAYWLERHLPAKQTGHPSCRVDWAERERDLLLRAATEVASMAVTSAASSPPERISASSVARRLCAVAILGKQKRKMPRLYDYLVSVTESDVAFAIRRMEWAVGRFMEERRRPDKWALYRRAGIRHEYDARFRERAETLISDIRANLETCNGTPSLASKMTRSSCPPARRNSTE
jgi:hypothetical protein